MAIRYIKEGESPQKYQPTPIPKPGQAPPAAITKKVAAKIPEKIIPELKKEIQKIEVKPKKAAAEKPRKLTAGEESASGKTTVITIRIDTDLLNDIKATGKNWQKRINVVLKKEFRKV